MRRVEGKRGAAREHRSPPAGVAEDPLAGGAHKALRMRDCHTPRIQRLGLKGLNRWWMEVLLRFWRGGVETRVSLVLVVTRSGLVISWGDISMRAQRGDKGVGWAVTPVNMGVHGGESELGENVQTVFIPARLFFSFSFSRVATSGSNKINLNPLVNLIHALPAKLAIPSNPHLPIIVLSCVPNKSSV